MKTLSLNKETLRRIDAYTAKGVNGGTSGLICAETIGVVFSVQNRCQSGLLYTSCKEVVVEAPADSE